MRRSTGKAQARLMRQTAQRAAMTAVQQARGSAGPASYSFAMVADGDDYHPLGLLDITADFADFYLLEQATNMALLKNDWTSGPLTSSWANDAADLLIQRAAVNAAGSGDLTLTADEYDSRVIELTGVLTGNRNIILPADDTRVWMVVNSTTGLYTTTFKTSAGAGVVVQQGRAQTVFADGVDIRAGDCCGVSVLDKALSDANTTLTGAEASRHTLRFTGTLTAGRDIVLPVLDGEQRLVKNGTGQALTFKAAGQTGVAVAAGKKAWILGNSTDWERATADV